MRGCVIKIENAIIMIEVIAILRGEQNFNPVYMVEK